MPATRRSFWPTPVNTQANTFMAQLIKMVTRLTGWLKSNPLEEKRIAKAKKHIKASFIIKGISIAISFLLVPLTIGYIDETLYGVWMTLFSIVSWFRFFDIGLDNGLRNKFAEALANKDIKLARTYLSTTYAILFIISAGLVFVFLLLNPWLDWSMILNAAPEYASELRMAVGITFGFFCLHFFLKLINTVVTADQRPALVGVINLITSVLTLIIIWVLTLTTEGSLVTLAWVMAGVPAIVLTGATIFFFTREYRKYLPSLKLIDFSHVRGLISLGSQFFVIQIIGIIIFSTDNLIISHQISPHAVTPYTITHKYFGIITRIFGIVALPFWSAYTEAYTKESWDWIWRTNRGLLRIWRMMALGSVGLLVASPFLFKIWVPEVDSTYWLLSVLMWVYVLILSYGSIFVMFINGIGKVRLQMISSLVGGILNIPLSIFFATHLGLGPAGVILATIICMLYGAVLGPIQFRKIMEGRATGIWNK